MFTPVLAKHSKSFDLIDTLAVGVDRIQRNFELMQHQVEHWKQTQLTDTQAKLILYSAFVDGKLDAPKSLLPEVHHLYFEPEYPEFSARTEVAIPSNFSVSFPFVVKGQLQATPPSQTTRSHRPLAHCVAQNDSFYAAPHFGAPARPSARVSIKWKRTNRINIGQDTDMACNSFQ